MPDRRRFLEASILVTGTGMALALGLPGASFLLTPLRREEERTWVDLGHVEDLTGAEVPIALRFNFVAWRGYVRGRKPGLLWIVPDAEDPIGVRVLSGVCTHKNCNVAWSPDEELFACPCHKGRFDASGEVVSGPPKSALRQITVRLEDGHLWAELGEAEA